MLDQAQLLRKIAIQKKQNLVIKNTNLKHPKIITIASGKGGVGKSNIVLNTAIELSKKGKKVIILDADIGMSNIEILLDVKINDTILSVINGIKTIDDIITMSKYGISIISGGTAINHIEDFTENQRKKFIEAIESINDIDYLLIDTGAGINKTLLSFVGCSNEFIIITTPEPTSITDAYSLLKAASNLNVINGASIIINRANSLNEVKESFERIKKVSDKFLDINLNMKGYLLDDKRVSQCVKKQVPFSIEYPNAQITICVRDVANKIIKNESLDDIGSDKISIRRIFNIFKY